MALLLAVIRYALSPVQALATAIAAIGEDDLDVRLDRRAAPTELAPVVDRLNDLLARLGSAFTRERELTAEVAHELRTPLAGLRATIEVTLGREREATRYRAALTDCLAICTQAERVVEAMLALARLEAEGVTARASEVDLAELVREVLIPFAPRASERQLTIETELAPFMRCDRDKFQVVLQNLIDNAISYADASGILWISATATRLRVINTGCTLTSEELAHVFERFWRGDRARSSGAHAGLGLALCKKLVQVMGGTIAAEVNDGRFIATVTLPEHPVS
jgi:two-component system, OmpR family, heavy metal sensor histidine kinase CusS